MARAKQWTKSTRPDRPELPNEREKEMIIAACEAFIADILKPRFLPQIRPTEWNYVIDIHGLTDQLTAAVADTGEQHQHEAEDGRFGEILSMLRKEQPRR